MELLGWLFWGVIYLGPILGMWWLWMTHVYPKNGRGEEPRYHGDGGDDSDGDGD